MQIENTFTYLGGPMLPTPLPWYAVNEKNPQDQVFTKPEIARACFDAFLSVAKRAGYDLNRHVFIEPSAGDGCFLDLLPGDRRIALDIDPKNFETHRANFLEWAPPNRGNYAVIGNPPFGVRGAIALAFVNRAAFFADLVGFILPMTFTSDGKGGAKTRVRGLHLLHSIDMPTNSFYDASCGGDKDINTVFQVWGRRKPNGKQDIVRTCKSFIELYSVSTYPSRRCGLAKMDEYDFFIQGTFYENNPPTVVADFAEVKYGSGYGIIIKKQKRKITEALKQTDWVQYSSRATNHCRHIRMQYIRQAIIDGGFHDKK